VSGRDWTDDSPHDPGVTLLELLAYVGDLLSYYQDRVAEEERLRTRRRYTLALAALLALLFIRRRRRPDD
jgi:hypothetical protein